ncbi:hypothetical protein AYL99_01979 [Fonsecaea erecta]|uniref:Uncharacterized protein n=1 Tax=Fonsecaea erecta TaxID=1367422 RepID=A0A178ZSR9_9EURO|nr:hypothetical protein AYL99_01979 [Fonsecaea erecta]OAP62752.1 hypothetical protein AYL99_01979 [Fonsecaea erecta]
MATNELGDGSSPKPHQVNLGFKVSDEFGYDNPDSLSRNGEVWISGCFNPHFEEFEQIKGVQDDFSDPSSSIHADEKLIAYTNRHFGKQIQLNIDENDSNDYGIKIDSLKDSGGLEIMFHRTAGGVFMPVWQREALWMSLQAPSDTYYTLRFFVGHINAVSGLEMKQTKEEPGDMEATPDYVIVPGPEWLDGICVAPGIVRQFVAMPLGLVTLSKVKRREKRSTQSKTFIAIAIQHTSGTLKLRDLSTFTSWTQPPVKPSPTSSHRPPPIDTMGYLEEGGSFFVVEEQSENRIDGGEVNNVKSVSAMDKHQDIKTEPSLDPRRPTQCKCGVRLCDCV